MTSEAHGYLDFDLHIESVGRRYRARATKPSGGVATVEFNRPFTKDQVLLLVLRLGRTRQVTRTAPGRVPAEEIRTVDEFGRKLFEKVFSGEVRVALDDSLASARESNKGLRIRLRLNDVPELADLPWEYLAIPTGEFLALSRFTPIVRYLDVPDPVPKLHVDGPLRMLVIMSNPMNSPVLDVEGEWRLLEQNLDAVVRSGQLTIERLPAANLSALRKRLETPDFHILHFIGHGGFDTGGKAGLLLLENESDAPVTVTAQDLAVYLRDLPALRLAVLNSCEGSRSATTDPFAGTAQTLVRRARLPAVVAMQFEITDTAATDFARGFYSALGAGFPVDAAVAEGRKEILAKGNRLEWGTPSLFMRSPDGRIFDVPRVERALVPAVAVPVAVMSDDSVAALLALPADEGPEQIPALPPAEPESDMPAVEGTPPLTSFAPESEPVSDVIEQASPERELEGLAKPILEPQTTVMGRPEPIPVPTPTQSDRVGHGNARRRRVKLEIVLVSVGLIALAALVFLRVGAISIEPTQLDFGDNLVGATTTAPITIHSNGWRKIDAAFLRGPDVADFALDTCTNQFVNPLMSCAIAVSFTPVDAGTKVAELEVMSGDLVLSIPVSGSAVSSTALGPFLAAQPGSVDFGLVPGGSPIDIQLSTTGQPALVTSVTVNQLGSAFNVALDKCSNATIGETQTCLIRIGYTPRGTDADAATLTVVSGGNRLIVPLSGPGLAPSTSPSTSPSSGPSAPPAAPEIRFAPTTIGFGKVDREKTSESQWQRLKIANIGNVPIDIRSISVAELKTEFTVEADPCIRRLQPGNNCEAIVTFTPAHTGLRETHVIVRTVQLKDRSIRVSGTEVESGGLEFDRPTLTYQAKTIDPRELSAIVTGTGPITIAEVTLEGEYQSEYSFVVDGCRDSHLEEGVPCTITVRYTPPTGDWHGQVPTRTADVAITSVVGTVFKIQLMARLTPTPTPTPTP